MFRPEICDFVRLSVCGSDRVRLMFSALLKQYKVPLDKTIHYIMNSMHFVLASPEHAVVHRLRGTSKYLGNIAPDVTLTYSQTAWKYSTARKKKATPILVKNTHLTRAKKK